MILQFLYTSWKYLLRTLLVIAGVFFVSILVVTLILQVPTTKNYLLRSIESNFNKNYHGELRVESLRGFIPFHAEIKGIIFSLQDEVTTERDTIIHIPSVDVRINPLDLISSRLSVHMMEIINPSVVLKYDSTETFYTINKVFQRRDDPELTPDPVVRKIDIIAPFLNIHNGSLQIQNRNDGTEPKVEPEFIQFSEIEMASFVEINEDLRFFDMQYLHFNSLTTNEMPFLISGQFFSDHHFVEFNGFRLSNGRNSIQLSGEIAGIDLISGDLLNDLKSARYALSIDSSVVHLHDYSTFFDHFSEWYQPLLLDVKLQGTLESMGLDRFYLAYGGSAIEAVGEVTDMLAKEDFRYTLDIRRLQIRYDEISSFLPDPIDSRVELLNNVTTRGRISGSNAHANLNLVLAAGTSDLRISGDISITDPLVYDVSVNTSEFDLSQLNSDFPKTRLNSRMKLHGEGIEPEKLTANLDVEISNSQIEHFSIDQIHIKGNYAESHLVSDLIYKDGNSSVEGHFEYWHDTVHPRYLLDGSAQNVDFSRFFTGDIISTTEVDFLVNLELTGRNLDDLDGQVNLDVTRALVGGEPVPEHQFYVDFSTVNADRRRVRFTSTFLDFMVTGTPNYTNILQLAEGFGQYLIASASNEMLFSDSKLSSTDQSIIGGPISNGLSSEFTVTIKNTDILGKYIPSLPLIDTDIQISGYLGYSDERFTLNTRWDGNRFSLNEVSLGAFAGQMTAILDPTARLADFSSIDLVFESNEVSFKNISSSSSKLRWSQLNNDIKLQAGLEGLNNSENRISINAGYLLADSVNTLTLNGLLYGSSSYLWQLTDTTRIILDRKHNLELDGLTLVSNGQSVHISGVYSTDTEDVMNVELLNVSLEAISDLIAGRLNFAGLVNGKIQTSSLFSDPVISGDLFVDHFRLDGRTIGDVTINSRFNPINDRFDVDISVFTDPAKYSTYLSDNNNIGQQIDISGYINAPDNPSVRDTLYYFDVDLKQVDAWVITPIIPDVFIRTEGVASGKGKLWGTIDHIDFTSRFDVTEVRATTQFLMTKYILSGQVGVDRNRGVEFFDVRVSDLRGGSGVLNGSVGFNEFQRERPFDLSLDMTRLEFLNNTFDPDVPFYGTVYGTGRVTLTGSNVSPFIRTPIPITTTVDSRLSIPLLDETTVEEQARFIQFVKSFSELYNEELTRDITQRQQEGERTFAETFRLDLQFIAPLNSTVQLVFDPLTGEILTARGSGRIRITLEDQNFQMFGGFNINSGEYIFVGGDIFVRRFQLRDGGTINWDGDPANARLNILTAYRARPNISILTPTFSDQQTRIPVDLMLEITGTIQSIENNFYFEFPNATDLSQFATALSLLNSEDQKLIQATSLLFTGGFIPAGLAGEGQSSELTSSIQARAGQVGLSQLLSNQINAILNSSLSNLDVDLNLTGFDQADIGIALRLFDDRLILRGESQYTSAVETGAETTLGDFGITYRINRSLSVEIFHRRDPTLRAIVGNQSQAESINGIGLEAQYQFNSWKEFRTRFLAQMRRIFGVQEEPVTTTSS